MVTTRRAGAATTANSTEDRFVFADFKLIGALAPPSLRENRFDLGRVLEVGPRLQKKVKPGVRIGRLADLVLVRALTRVDASMRVETEDPRVCASFEAGRRLRIARDRCVTVKLAVLRIHERCPR